MPHDEIPAEYIFVVEKIKNIKTEDELIRNAGQIVDMIRHLDDVCERNGWPAASKDLKSSACILLGLIRSLIEKNLSKAA